MIIVSPRNRVWAELFWPRCLEGLDPVKTYGPEVNYACHPGDRYWAIVEPLTKDLGDPGHEGDFAYGIATGELDTYEEIGMAWASRFENNFMWTYGLAFFPEHRRQAKGAGYEVSRAILKHLFDVEHASTAITMVYSTNEAAMRYNGLAHGEFKPSAPYRRLIGCVADAAGPGIDLWLFQTMRKAWEEYQRSQQ